MPTLQADIDAAIAAEKETHKRLRELRERRESLEQARRMEELEHLKPLAIRAHGLLCSWNHTDGCGWCYEVKDGQHNWVGQYSAHARWLAAVEKWFEQKPYGERLTIDKLVAILDIIEAGKKVHKDFLGIVRNVIKSP